MNGKGDKELLIESSNLDGKEANNLDKDVAMNIESNAEGKDTDDKLANETNKGGEMTKEKVEIPESFFKLKEKLKASI